MGLLSTIKAFFLAILGISKAVEKGLPSEKIQEAKFDIKKPTEISKEVIHTADKRNKLVDEMFGDLEGHPEISIENKVRFECPELTTDEQAILVSLLTQRLDASHRYNRLRNKMLNGKSKFKL